MPQFIKPELEDLHVLQELLEDHKTMSALGGIHPFPDTEWKSFYQDWVEQDPKDAFFRLMYCRTCEDFIGQSGWKKLSDDVALLELLVKNNMRQMGYGNTILLDLVKKAKETGFSIVQFHLNAMNPSISFFLKRGFQILSKDEDMVILSSHVDNVHSPVV